MWRYGCQKFEFGEQEPFVNRKGEPATAADWGLVVSGHWRVRGPDGFELNDGHFGDYPDLVRTDDHAEGFYSLIDENPLVIESILLREDGTLGVSFSQGFRLEVEPPIDDSDDPEEAHPGEVWRLMPPDDAPRGHLVFDFKELAWSCNRP